MTKLGHGHEPRLRPALRWLRGERRRDGSWALDAMHPDLDPAHGGHRLHGPVFPPRPEPVAGPSRSSTVEALSVLGRVETA